MSRTIPCQYNDCDHCYDQECSCHCHRVEPIVGRCATTVSPSRTEYTYTCRKEAGHEGPHSAPLQVRQVTVVNNTVVGHGAIVEYPTNPFTWSDDNKVEMERCSQGCVCTPLEKHQANACAEDCAYCQAQS